MMVWLCVRVCVLCVRVCVPHRVCPKIQAAWRGYIVRAKELGWIWQQILNLRHSVATAKAAAAALTIQRVFRGWTVRKFVATEVRQQEAHLRRDSVTSFDGRPLGSRFLSCIALR